MSSSDSGAEEDEHDDDFAETYEGDESMRAEHGNNDNSQAKADNKHS